MGFHRLARAIALRDQRFADSRGSRPDWTRWPITRVGSRIYSGDHQASRRIPRSDASHGQVLSRGSLDRFARLAVLDGLRRDDLGLGLGDLAAVDGTSDLTRAAHGERRSGELGPGDGPACLTPLRAREFPEPVGLSLGGRPAAEEALRRAAGLGRGRGRSDSNPQGEENGDPPRSEPGQALETSGRQVQGRSGVSPRPRRCSSFR